VCLVVPEGRKLASLCDGWFFSPAALNSAIRQTVADQLRYSLNISLISMNSFLVVKWIHIRVSIGYTDHMGILVKDVGLRLRVEKELRQEFVDACRASGKPAAQVLREFMRDFVTRERLMMQRPLFEENRR
jgi:hypothetical protein